MAIPSGTKLGSYEIFAQIGAGGMGEVYQAHDTKLGRDVAIKVLPEAFAHDPERLARFQREAKMLASLNHPNIAIIHGLEQSGSTSYLVMELVPGETLQDRVKRDGAVPIEESLAIAKQIAEALEAAHEKGIIHRDLKPANVKVTPEGKVKVLDFGLAKAFEGDSVTEDMSNSPTLSRAATMQGVILGTAAYMSPEQARGKSVDKRTDIWAFGCVLYELLTGKEAFHGEDITEILAAVVLKEPALDALPANIYPPIRVLLQRCLRKDRRQRFHDAADVRIEIQEALSAPATGVPTVPEVHKGTVWRWTMISGLALLIVAAIAGLAIWNLKPTPPVAVTRSVFLLPPGQRFLDLTEPVVAISPDGKQLVYVASGGGAQQLYVRPMDSFDAKAVPGTEGGSEPFFSPDSQWIGFFAGGKLKKVSISGGAAVTLSDASEPRGGAWGPDNTIVLSPAASSVISVVPAAGGTPQPLTTLDSKNGEGSHRWPEFLPGGKAVLFNATTFNAQTAAAPLALYVRKTGERRDLMQVGMRPRYAPSGHLLFSQGGTLMAVPFDPGRLQVTGAAAPILEGIMQSASTGATQYSFSDSGTLVYIPGGNQAAERQRLVWVDRKGTEQALAVPAHAFERPRVSPEGRRIAVAIAEPGNQIWIYDLSRETLTRLTFEGRNNVDAVWTPDGKRVTFESGPPGNLFWQPADGSGKAERLTTNKNGQIPNSWSPDGQVLAFAEVGPASRAIWTFRLSDRKSQVFLQTPFNEGAPVFSPDGRWLAYGSDESNRPEIYVQPYPGPGGKWQISTDGGTEPTWNHNGRELFYRQGNKMMAVDVTTQPTFSAGKPRMLFEGQYSLNATPSTRNYDVSLDGQRFLMVKPGEQEQTTAQINLVLNWFEELKQRVPAGKK
jgi:serine/threonine protein kinase/Tol biopolymer transport system component